MFAKIFCGLGKCFLTLRNSFCILENTFLRLENYFCGLEKYLLGLEKSLQALANTFRNAKKPRRTLLLSPQPANINQSAMQIAKRYLEFDAEAKEFMHHLSGAYSRLAVSPTQYQRMAGELADWTAALALYIDPNTHTPAAVQNARAQYNLFHRSILALRRQLKNSQDIDLTADDYAALGVHKDKTTRTRPPVPNIAPVNVLHATHHLVNEFITSAPTTSEVHHRALPPGVQRIGRALALTDAGITPSRDEYHAIAAVGTSTHKIKFAPADEGKVGWLITWYVNTRGEMGPESEGLGFRVV